MQDPPSKEWFFSFLPTDLDSLESLNHSLILSDIALSKTVSLEMQNPWDFDLDLAIATEIQLNDKTRYKNYLVRIPPHQSISLSVAKLSGVSRTKFVSLSGFRARAKMKDGEEADLNDGMMESRSPAGVDCFTTDYCLGCYDPDQYHCMGPTCYHIFNVKSELTGAETRALFRKRWGQYSNQYACINYKKHFALDVYWPTDASTPFHIGTSGFNFPPGSCGEKCEIFSYPTNQATTGRKWDWIYYSRIVWVHSFDEFLFTPGLVGKAICPNATVAKCEQYNYETFKVFTRDF